MDRFGSELKTYVTDAIIMKKSLVMYVGLDLFSPPPLGNSIAKQNKNTTFVT